jgi:hypothetical protein
LAFTVGLLFVAAMIWFEKLALAKASKLS